MEELYQDPWDDKITLGEVESSFNNLKKKLIDKRTMGQVQSIYDKDLMDIPIRDMYTSTERHARVSANLIAQQFGIGTERARQTMKSTLQRGTRSAILPISRRY